MDEDIKLPEPVAWIAEYGGDIYTADQLRAAVEADRARRMKSVADLILPPPAAYLNESSHDCLEARRRDYYSKGSRNDGMKAFASACSIPLYTEEQVRLLVEPEFHARIAALRQVQALQWAAESAPEQPARKPLTDEQILDGLSTIGVTVWGQRSEDFEAGARFAERMHGIGEKMP